MTTIYCDRRGLRLAAHTWGKRGSPVVLMIHGFLDCGRSWTDIADLLQDDYYVIAPDMRGFGESGWVGAGGYYHFYDYYDDVLGWLRSLEIEEFSLIGHSMGGSIATGVAAIEGSRCGRLILLEGMGPPASNPNHSMNRLRLWAAAMARDKTDGDINHRRSQRRILPDLAAAASRLRKYNPRLTPQRAMTFASYLTEPADAGVVFRHDPLHITPAAKPYWIEEAAVTWQSLAAPVLVLSGGESKMPTEDLPGRVAHLPDGRSYVVPGAGHNIHHDRPELVASAIRSWLEDPLAALDAELSAGFPKASRPASV
jgi:pimeloyl-ACP methyl ester carboxylesterase